MTSTDRVRLVDVRDRDLDPAEALAAVRDRSAGGYNLFVGAVRDHDGAAGAEKVVTRLEYSAHPTALERLRAVAAEVAADHEATAVAVLHRTGLLDVGEVTVVVAVSAAHRASAYAGSRALIDRLKAEVPIWKRQVFADGTEEWVGTP